jgi:TfoX/Sxy family transcriptional regulator of competence genes
MPYDQHLAERIQTILSRRGIPYEEKKMMGGLCFMVDQKMLAGVVHDQLMARVGPQQY